MNNVLQEDIANFSLDEELIKRLKDKTIIITGSTGLIGSVMVRCFNKLGIRLHLILPVRNVEKAASMFKGSDNNIDIIETEIVEYFSKIDFRADYIIHCASPTNGKYMIEHPLETFRMATETTDAILRYAARVKCESVVYLSSIEYYGEVTDDEPLTEDMKGFVNNHSLRSSYPLGKQAAEFIAYCYAKEYDVNVKTARLTQTFGAGVAENDNRVFMQFARSIIAGRDIELHTLGKSAKSYCYTTDCVKAIVYILIFGQKGEAYNVANPNTYISIRDLAEYLCKEFNPAISIKYNLSKDTGYAPETHTNLSVDKLIKLGWTPEHDLKSMFSRLISSLRN